MVIFLYNLCIFDWIPYGCLANTFFLLWLPVIVLHVLRGYGIVSCEPAQLVHFYKGGPKSVISRQTV